MDLITGGSGFLGSHLARYLLDECESDEVRVLDPQEPPADLRDRVGWIEGSVLEPDAVRTACAGADVVYHTAALVPLSKAGRGFGDVNTQGTAAVAEAALDAGVSRFIHVSSSAIYDPGTTEMPITEDSPLRPIGAYGRSKLDAERVVRDAGTRGLAWAIIRPRTIVDTGRGGIFQILFEWAREGRRLYTIGDGSNQLQLVSARDVASACVLAARTPDAVGEVFVVGADSFGSLGDAMGVIAHRAGAGSRVTPLPADLARAVLRILDKTGLSPLAEWHYRTMDKPFWFSTAKASRVLGWQPEDSNRRLLERSYDWYALHHEEIDRRPGTGHRHSPRQRLLRLLRRVS